jgi:hypothetical protein
VSGCGGSKGSTSEHKVGEKVIVEKLSLTVDRVTRNLPQGTDTKTEALGVHLTISNEGKFPLSFKLEDLTLHDAQKKIYDGYPDGGPGSLLGTGRYLAMGDKITGTLIFQIPKGASGLVLRYEPKKLKKVFMIHLS